jgi:ubiquitin-activating enzyme E1
LQITFGHHLDAIDGLPTVNPDQFEKDDDTNFHVDFLHAMTNLRVRNYGLEEYDWLQVGLPWL